MCMPGVLVRQKRFATGKLTAAARVLTDKIDHMISGTISTRIIFNAMLEGPEGGGALNTA